MTQNSQYGDNNGKQVSLQQIRMLLRQVVGPGAVRLPCLGRLVYMITIKVKLSQNVGGKRYGTESVQHRCSKISIVFQI